LPENRKPEEDPFQFVLFGLTFENLRYMHIDNPLSSEPERNHQRRGTKIEASVIGLG
jgi:hypothetical protein